MRDGESTDLHAKLAQTRLLAMDVDGVLTDGTLGYSSEGAEERRFHVADGLGLVALRQTGILIAWVSGRANPLVERRARELGVPHILQGVRDKGAALERLTRELTLDLARVAYIGDDWNDLPAFEAVGVRIAVAGAAREVVTAADYVTDRRGGQGAVREVCEMILDALDQRDACLRAYLDSVRAPEDRVSIQDEAPSP